MAPKAPTHIDYTVGWVCALPKEFIAAVAMLDERHDDLPRQPNDHNAYTLGRIGLHNIVVACLPKGEIGTNNAATVATRMTSTFPSIKFGLMVGIGGGVPKSVRLGDVVVSTPGGKFGGVVQWDFGKAQQGGTFERTGSLNRPPAELLAALTKVEREHEMIGSRIPQYLKDLETNWPKLALKYTRSASLKDVLFRADCEHVETTNTGEGQEEYDEDEDEEEDEEKSPCIHCDQTKVVRRKPRDMRVHYGLIASGNRVVKDAQFRDEINKNLGGKVLCFEMEAAGLMNDFPCLVIRGICDYADAHKNKEWQEHAAAVAAAFSKELLMFVPAQEVEQMPAIKQFKEQLEGVCNAVDEIRTHQRDHQRDQEYRAILDWLTPVNYATQQNYFMTQKQEGTNEWLLKSSEFKDWLEQTNHTLFCPGIPGAGKTIVTATVIHHLHAKFRDDSSVGIAYLYCTFKQQREQGPVPLMTNILKQLAMGQPTLPQGLKDLYYRHKDRQSRPELREITSTLHDVAATYSKTFILVDALDECQIVRNDLDVFIREIFNFQAVVKANIFATSRFIQHIELKFQKATRLEIRADEADVERYLQGKLQDCQSLSSQNASLRERIKHAIAKAVDGMFLLAQLYVDSLACKTTVKGIKQTLQELEASSASSQARDEDTRARALDNAYEQAMERIQGQVPEHRKLATQVLSWISCARRRLTLAELQHALGVEENTSELDEDAIPNLGLIVSTCTGLVVVDMESDVVRLVHHTTQEYFQRTWQRWFPNAQIDIAKACATYLSFEVFKTGTTNPLEDSLPSNVFWDYAAANWGHHAVHSLDGGILTLTLLEDTALVSACGKAIYRMDSTLGPRREHFRALHLAAYFGLSESVSILLDKGADVDAWTFNHRTPLWFAAMYDHGSVVKVLLDNNADVERPDRHGKTPLYIAAEEGHEAVVRILLDGDANVESSDPDGRTPLHIAARKGHEAVVRILLDSDANVESSDQYQNIPFFFGVMQRHKGAAAMLLDNDAKVEPGPTGSTPLFQAALKGHGGVVGLLLDNGANIESSDPYSRTPLYIAAEEGHGAVVRILLDSDANIESPDCRGRTPLHAAAEKGHEAVVRTLLDNGANVESLDHIDKIPLHHAAMGGHDGVVRLLLDNGANVESSDPYSRTLLYHAAQGGHEAVVRLLLDNGATVECFDRIGRTPLHVAAEKGHEAVVRLLLGNGANTDRIRMTPLHHAAMRGQEEVVRLLVDNGANIQSAGQRGQTALSLAINSGNQKLVNLLLKKKTSIS
ncbi:unnamed protein product [Penicillium viridicatum]